MANTIDPSQLVNISLTEDSTSLFDLARNYNFFPRELLEGTTFPLVPSATSSSPTLRSQISTTIPATPSASSNLGETYVNTTNTATGTMTTATTGNIDVGRSRPGYPETNYSRYSTGMFSIPADVRYYQDPEYIRRYEAYGPNLGFRTQIEYDYFMRNIRQDSSHDRDYESRETINKHIRRYLENNLEIRFQMAKDNNRVEANVVLFDKLTKKEICSDSDFIEINDE